MDMMCDAASLVAQTFDSASDALSDQQIDDILVDEFGAMDPAALLIAKRAALAVTRHLAAKLAHKSDVLESVVERAARICEAYCDCGEGDETEEFNRTLIARAGEIRALTDAASASLKDPDEFVLTSSVSKLCVPDQWKVRKDNRSGDIYISKDGVGGCKLDNMDGTNYEANLFYHYLRDQLQTQISNVMRA